MAIIDNYSKEDLIDIVKNSYSIAEVIKKLGYHTSNGRNSDVVKKRIQEYNIDTSHFRTVTPTIRSREEIFQNNSGASQATVRRWFKKEDVPYICSICGQKPIWNNKQLTMILDHKNGNKNDHRLENLRYVCPNCNQQLITTGFKGYVYNENGLKVKHTDKTDNAENFCIDCGKPITQKAIRCIKCNNIYLTRDISKTISREELKEKIRVLPFIKIGKQYDVTDNAIRKWCIKYDLPTSKRKIKQYTDIEWEAI